MKSDVCFSKKTGQPLTVYFSEADAKSSALYVIQNRQGCSEDSAVLPIFFVDCFLWKQMGK